MPGEREKGHNSNSGRSRSVAPRRSYPVRAALHAELHGRPEVREEEGRDGGALVELGQLAKVGRGQSHTPLLAGAWHDEGAEAQKADSEGLHLTTTMNSMKPHAWYGW